MSQVATPICFFPGSTLFVDDSHDFLINFTLESGDDIAYRLFASPFDALEDLQSRKSTFNGINERCMSEYLESTAWPLTNQTVNVDLSAIHTEVNNPQRFLETTVIVVDYAMPGMNGLDFCRSIKDLPIKKIMLTGQADEQIAIEAFNEGLIDKFIRKNQHHVAEQISQSIADLHMAYFKGMSDMIIKMLALNSSHFLNDPAFADFMNKVCEKHRIVEYYLIESSGSFLMLDEDAAVYALIVKSEQDLQYYYELAQDNDASADVLTALKTGEHIPYFYNQVEDWENCEKYLHKAEKVTCDQVYYCSLIKDNVQFDINKESIKSYSTYLDELHKETGR